MPFSCTEPELHKAKKCSNTANDIPTRMHSPRFSLRLFPLSTLQKVK